MNIGIDASRAFIKKRTGTEEYSYQLIKNLTKVDTSSHQVFLYVKKKSKINFNLPKNFIAIKICYNKLWTQIGLSLEIKKNTVDVLFIPSHTIPIIHPKKTIVTIHGLEFKYYPTSYSFKEKLFLELNTFIAVKWSNKIIVPSESTKKDLIKFYKVDSDKIKVVYHGVSSIKYPVLSIKHNNQYSFNILFIGRLEKRKNLVNLIKAFDIFKKRYEIRDTKSKLILVGKKGFGFDEIKKTIQESPYRKDIILKDYVSEDEKNKLYKKADLFILPSLYEGFGLPILEAMSYGVPVVCSNSSSLLEVADEVALLINPNNIQEIANAMDKIFTDDNFREKMIERGLENVKRFSWKKCVRETINILSNC
ncbi:MAG: glycosyltransferase family 4 protein [Candidatus Pacebacteria bacterium]|nr:glycosyltransferase family 4 protein [Candidatus Paceibacterota bacterium]